MKVEGPSADVPAAPSEWAYPEPPRARPSKGWMWLGLGLVVASLVAGAIIWFVGRYQADRTVENFARFVAPGQADLRFRRGGEYTLYYEFRGQIDDQEIAAPETPPDGIELRVSETSGRPLLVVDAEDADHYRVSGFEGVALGRVEVGDAGTFTVEAAAPDQTEPFAIAVGRGALPSSSDSDRLALIVAIVGSAIGLLVMLAVAFRRRHGRAPATTTVDDDTWRHPPAPPPPPPADDAEPLVAAPQPVPSGLALPAPSGPPVEWGPPPPASQVEPDRAPPPPRS